MNFPTQGLGCCKAATALGWGGRGSDPQGFLSSKGSVMTKIRHIIPQACRTLGPCEDTSVLLHAEFCPSRTL